MLDTVRICFFFTGLVEESKGFIADIEGLGLFSLFWLRRRKVVCNLGWDQDLDFLA